MLEFSEMLLSVQRSVSPAELREMLDECTYLARQLACHAPTPDSLRPFRADFDDITNCVSLFLANMLGCSVTEPSQALSRNGEDATSFESSVSIHRSHGMWDALRSAYAFFQSVSDWLVGGYRENSIHRSISATSDVKKKKLQDASTELARQLCDSADDLLFEDDLECGEGEVIQHGRSLRLLRLLTMASARPTQTGDAEFEAVRDIGCIPEQTAVSFVVELFQRDRDSPSTSLALFTFQRDYVDVWTSASGTTRWIRAADAIREQRLDQIDVACDSSSMIGDSCFQNNKQRIGTVAVVDLTTRNVPIPIVEDQCGLTAFASSRIPGHSAQAPTSPSISFWATTSPDSNLINVDNLHRRVMVDASHQQLVFEYPRLPEESQLTRASSRDPLPFTHYEKWMFEDLEKGSCRIQSHTADLATRSAFLESVWNDSDIIHLSMHGNAYAAAPEAAHLVFAGDGEGPNRLHYYDVLALDLAQVQLIFLNACQTRYGQQWTGNEDMSLAWAFRAAGAKSVIATRWKVADAAAWFFASKFYEAWLHEDRRLRRAFADAVQATRQHPHFAKPHLWGAFTLLE
jgi:hypothetical protein